MAEQAIAGVDQESAGTADSSAANRPAEQQYLTREEFEERFSMGLNGLAQHMQAIVNKAFDGNKSHFDRAVHQIASSLGVSQEKANLMLEEMATEQGIGPERIAAVQEKLNARTKAQEAEAKQRETEAELAAERAGNSTAAEQQRLASHQSALNAAWDSMVDLMGEFGTDQGVDAKPHIDKVRAQLIKEGAFQSEVGEKPSVLVNKVARLVKASISVAADARHQASQGRVELDTAAGGGAGGTAFDNYIKSLRDGKNLPSPAEIDRLTAGRYS